MCLFVTSEIQNLFDFVRFVWTGEFKEVFGGERKRKEIETSGLHHVFIAPVSKNLYFHLCFILHKYAT